MTRKDIAKLSDEEANVEIAKLCGWDNVGKHPFTGSIVGFPKGAQDIDDWHIIPSYCSDLNLMAEVEKSMTDNQRVHFRLSLMFNSDGPKAVYRTVEAALCHATPRERAEAFLATIGQGGATDEELTTVADDSKKKVKP